jgi:hypothetical protein
MASRKQYHKIIIPGSFPLRSRDTVVGGQVISDYHNPASGVRTLVIEMPQAKPKAKKRGPVAQAAAEAIERQRKNADTVTQEVGHGA